ncbi:MAG: hypothetical protein ACE5JP_10490 [Candidatus Bipolaricaulia bacterium]
MGVHPETQGKGHRRALLNAIHALSEAHPTSIGVALDTENPVNVPLYKHFGYRIVKKTKLDDVDVWCMFRPNGAEDVVK